MTQTRREENSEHQTHYHPGYQLPSSPNQNSNGNGSSFRYWLPLWLFMAAQLGGGIWWMATVSADVRALTREVGKLEIKHDVLDLKQQRMERDFVRFETRAEMAQNEE